MSLNTVYLPTPAQVLELEESSVNFDHRFFHHIGENFAKIAFIIVSEMVEQGLTWTDEINVKKMVKNSSIAVAKADVKEFIKLYCEPDNKHRLTETIIRHICFNKYSVFNPTKLQTFNKIITDLYLRTRSSLESGEVFVSGTGFDAEGLSDLHSVVERCIATLMEVSCELEQAMDDVQPEPAGPAVLLKKPSEIALEEHQKGLPYERMLGCREHELCAEKVLDYLAATSDSWFTEIPAWVLAETETYHEACDDFELVYYESLDNRVLTQEFIAKVHRTDVSQIGQQLIMLESLEQVKNSNQGSCVGTSIHHAIEEHLKKRTPEEKKQQFAEAYKSCRGKLLEDRNIQTSETYRANPVTQAREMGMNFEKLGKLLQDENTPITDIANAADYCGLSFQIRLIEDPK